MDSVLRHGDSVAPRVEFPCYVIRAQDHYGVWLEDNRTYAGLNSAKEALENLAQTCVKPKSLYIVHDIDEWHREFIRLLSWNLDKSPNYRTYVYTRHGYLWHWFKSLFC